MDATGYPRSTANGAGFQRLPAAEGTQASWSYGCEDELA